MNSDSTPTASFSLTSASDQFATADVEDINDGQLDDTVLIYTDNNQVHLELLNQNGVQIGSDFVVPGLTSFDQIEALTGASSHADTRVEIDYTVADPRGGTEVEGLIYDTVGAPDDYTLGGNDSNEGNGGNGEYSGTPFNDTVSDAPGTYTINGGGGDDYFIVNYNASQVQISENSAGDVIVTTPTGVATLQLFSTIVLNDATVTISGSMLTQHNSDGTSVVYTFNITGQPYTAMVKSFGASGNKAAVEYEGYTGEPYDAKTIFYNSSGALQNIVFNADRSAGAIGGQAYDSYETIDNASKELLATVYHHDNGQCLRRGRERRDLANLRRRERLAECASDFVRDFRRRLDDRGRRNERILHPRLVVQHSRDHRLWRGVQRRPAGRRLRLDDGLRRLVGDARRRRGLRSWRSQHHLHLDDRRQADSRRSDPRPASCPDSDPDGCGL